MIAARRCCWRRDAARPRHLWLAPGRVLGRVHFMTTEVEIDLTLEWSGGEGAPHYECRLDDGVWRFDMPAYDLRSG